MDQFEYRREAIMGELAAADVDITDCAAMPGTVAV
jgi:hypothetical protein